MGTRSLTRVFDADDSSAQVVCVYRQFDGYPSGHGKDLAEFLDGFTVGNGIGANSPPKFANGAGCLAAQLVKHFKDGPGGIYLMPSNCKDAGQSYEYHVTATEDQAIKVRVFGGGKKCKPLTAWLDVAAFAEFCARN